MLRLSPLTLVTWHRSLQLASGGCAHQLRFEAGSGLAGYRRRPAEADVLLMPAQRRTPAQSGHSSKARLDGDLGYRHGRAGLAWRAPDGISLDLERQVERSFLLMADQVPYRHVWQAPSGFGHQQFGSALRC